MSPKLTLRGVPLAASLLLLAGCYTYVPVSTTPKVGERVRIALTAEGMTDLARYLGPRVAVAEGTLNSNGGDAMVVAVDFVQLIDGTRQPWSGEGVVSFPTNYVANVRQRTLLRRQSIIAGTGLTAALAAVAIVALKAGSAGGSDCPGCGPPPP